VPSEARFYSPRKSRHGLLRAGPNASKDKGTRDELARSRDVGSLRSAERTAMIAKDLFLT
jgi:hypothetical protein